MVSIHYKIMACCRGIKMAQGMLLRRDAERDTSIIASRRSIFYRVLIPDLLFNQFSEFTKPIPFSLIFCKQIINAIGNYPSE